MHTLLLLKVCKKGLCNMATKKTTATIMDMATNVKVGARVMVRTYSAGVFAGILVGMVDKQAVLHDARRIWRWAGAASLSELAQVGTHLPGECKFPVPVDEVVLTEVTEVIAMTDEAWDSIMGVPVWTGKPGE